jgi:hypothetical protein
MMTYIPLAQIEPFTPPAAGSGVREENQDRFAGFILLRSSGILLQGSQISALLWRLSIRTCPC